jgi:hypothetical protein
MMFMSRTLATEDILSLLADAPARIAAATAELSAARLRTSPAAGEWSANEVLAHLRSCADVWGDYMARILIEDRPTIKAVNPTTWIIQTDYPSQAFRPSLRRFATQRATLLEMLRPLTTDQWSRTATITGAGAPLQKTVSSYAERLARHERAHVAQIRQIVAAV